MENKHLGLCLKCKNFNLQLWLNVGNGFTEFETDGDDEHHIFPPRAYQRVHLWACNLHPKGTYFYEYEDKTWGQHYNGFTAPKECPYILEHTVEHGNEY